MKVVHLDARQLRTMAHPLRVRLLALLRADGPATATRLAQVTGTNTGATSYHLRQLAEVGLVVEELDRATGRERWWRAAHDVSSWRPTDFENDPDAAAASELLEGFGLRTLAEEAERWTAVRGGFSREWREAASFNDALLRLTPTRLRALMDEMHELVGRYRAAPDEGDDAEQVIVAHFGFPRRVER
jgi:DNA-binding transcriptional ArsR family regulator